MHLLRSIAIPSVVVGAVLLLASPGDARSSAVHVASTPLGRTGGFGEPTCLECHDEFELNPEGGSLEVSGLPGRYEPGRTYRWVVRVVGEGMAKGGFQASARFAEGAAVGAQAGTLESTSSRAVVSDSAGVSYARHSQVGVDVSEPDAIEWSLSWTAPAVATGAVAFHVAANSANGDDSPLGDWVLAAERIVLQPESLR